MRSEFTSAHHQSSVQLMNTSIEEINNLVVSIKNVENTVMAQVNQLDQIVNSFNNKLQNDISNITVHDSAELLLTPLTDSLHSIANDLQSRYNIDSQRVKNTHNIIGRYTMQSEREVHTNFTKSSDDVSGRIGTPGNDADCLGDNIELF
jgi:hypothetical protein